MNRKLTRFEYLLLATVFVLTLGIIWSAGQVTALHDALVLAMQNRIITAVPATDRTNYASHTDYETNH